MAYSRSPAIEEPDRRRMKSRSSMARRSGSPSTNSYTGLAQKIRPITDAAWSPCLSAASNRSTRAATTACTVSGTEKSGGRSANVHPSPSRISSPRSMRVPSTSSTKNGFPSARSTTTSPRPGGRAPPRSSSSMRTESSAESASSATVAPRERAPHPGRVSSNSGRAVASTSTGARPPPGGGREQGGGSRRQHEHGRARVGQEPLQEVEQEVLRPMDVFDEHHEGASSCYLLEERDPRVLESVPCR